MEVDFFLEEYSPTPLSEPESRLLELVVQHLIRLNMVSMLVPCLVNHLGEV